MAWLKISELGFIFSFLDECLLRGAIGWSALHGAAKSPHTFQKEANILHTFQKTSKDEAALESSANTGQSQALMSTSRRYQH